MPTFSPVRSLVMLALLAPIACAVSPGAPEEETGSSAAAVTSPGSGTPVFGAPTSDTATSVSVKNGMTLSLHASLKWHTGSSGEELILEGSTSQDLTFASGFIPDDAFGAASLRGPKSFELVFDNASDINTVVSGEPFYVELGTHSASLGDTEWVAEVIIAPRLVPTATTTPRLVIGDAVTAVYVTTNPEGVVFRGTATTNEVPSSLTVTADSPPTLVQDAPHAWHFDWDFSSFESAATGGDVKAKGKFGAVTSTRDSTLEIRVATLALAVGDSPDDTYGFPYTCDPTVLACLGTLPASTSDFGACGDYFDVTVCVDTVGFPVP